MCGIAGILGKIDETNRAALTRMADAMLHRGPDGGGTWIGEPGRDGFGCLLAHRRLSILDLSTAADQPMIDPVTGQVVVFNGELYNYRALREELQRDGETFSSSGDTAVLLRLLATRGPAACARLRGMFAVGLWDERRRQLVLARDPLGIKPLYVAWNPDPAGAWRLLFASEVRAILASGLLPSRTLDPVALQSVIWSGFVAGPGTMVRGITSVWPGQTVTVSLDEHDVDSSIFWSARRDEEREPSTLEEVRDALQESVRLHLASDVPLGVFLSAGIDSTAVANLAQKVSDQPINTFTLAFEEEELNEGHLAREIATAIGTSHREVVLTEQAFVADLERAVDTLDQPTFDGLNSFYMSRAVREAGLTVALVGTGGDELFGGYKTFRDLPTLLGLAQRTRWLPKGGKVAAARLWSAISQLGSGPVAPQTRWAKLPDMLGAGEDIIELYQLAYALFLPAFQKELLRADVIAPDVRHGLPLPLLDRLSTELHGRSPLSAISVLEQRLFLGERLLRDTDAASMAVSLELRVPLVDQALFEVVDRLPDLARYAPLGRKQALRELGHEGLDPALFERPKRGFVLPFDRWIRRGLGEAMDDTMRDPDAARACGLDGAAVARLWDSFQQGAPGMYWSRVWSIYALMRWCQRHGVTV